jgi:hypothetical protein
MRLHPHSRSATHRRKRAAGPELRGSGISYVVFGSDVPSINGSSVYADNLTFNSPSPVPEPSSWAMMLIGLGALGVHLRRQRRRWQAQVLST